MPTPDARPCPRCGKPQPPDSVHTCSPRRPDARPVGEMRDAEREAENEVLHLALRLANWDPPSVMDLKDAPLLEEHARALAAYRDACKATARAALLRDAPVVWAARDGGGLRLFTEKPRDSHATFVDAIIFIAETRAFGLPDSIADALGLALGECARVRITREEA